MWGNKVAPISNQLLLVKDYDTHPDNVTYFVSTPKGGYVALVTSPMIPITNFTQTALDNKKIAFVRSASKFLI